MKVFLTCFLILLPAFSFSKVTLNLWHAYRGGEKTAIEKAVESFNLSHQDIQVRPLAVPFDAYRDKLIATIPMKNGPDIFIAGAGIVGYFSEMDYILPLESYLTPEDIRQYMPHTVKAFQYMYEGAIWGIPSCTKNLALFYNKALIKNPPNQMSELLDSAKKFTQPNRGQYGKWGLAYEIRNFYYHMVWVQGFGGRFFREIDTLADGVPVLLPLIYSEPMIRAGDFVRNRILSAGICPAQTDGTTVTYLFNSGNALFVINGQWFRGEIDRRVNYGVTDFPFLEENARRPVPLIGVEGFFMSSHCRDQDAAMKAILYFTSPAMGKVMASIGKQTPAQSQAFDYAEVRNDPIQKVFQTIAERSLAMSTAPEMTLAWGPFTAALGDILDGNDTTASLKKHQTKLMSDIARFRKNPSFYTSRGFSETDFKQPILVK